MRWRGLTATGFIVLCGVIAAARADATKDACGHAYDRFYTPTLETASSDMSRYFAVGRFAGVEQACTSLAFSVADTTRADPGTAPAIRETALTTDAYADLAGRAVYKACMVNSTRRLIGKADYRLTREAFVADCPFDSLLYPAGSADRAAPAVIPPGDADRQASHEAWTVALRDKVGLHWMRPKDLASGLACTARIELIPNGEVVDTRITRPSGDVAFDASVEEAIFEASPLPLPSEPSAYQRVLLLDFDVDELLR